MAKLFSKTDYVHGIQCPKWLWMQANKKEEFDAKWLDAAKLSMGTGIGDLARGYYGEYELVKGSFRYLEKMAEKTAQAIADGHKTICEATFIANGCVCLVDILRVLPGKVLEFAEVKSSTSVKPEHITDVSFQRAVVQAAMPDWYLRRASVMHVNGKYVRQGDIDLQQLFSVEDVTDRLAEPDEVMDRVEMLRRYVASDEEPDKEIGMHCGSPHPCPYSTYCLKGRDATICELAGRGHGRGFAMIAKGIDTYGKALSAMQLKGLALTQACLAGSGKGRHFDHGRISGFMASIHYPLYFLDFETIQSGVPMWDGNHPYQQVTTQFSLHWLDCEGGLLRHTEYLAPSEGEPMRGVAEALVSAIPDGACVTAYNMAFEKARIREMADAFPLLAGRLMRIHDSIVDLMVPFQKGWYYLPAMGGSCSIKRVLPALFPDDPELDYHALDGVHCGTEATAAFLKLASLPAEERGAIREQLLRYCELDTLAMVKVYQSLVEALAEEEREARAEKERPISF